MSSVPNWQLLPQFPVEFFGLIEGFDRKDLKRAYGALIKQFKPESHPAEFQRIREAYETLESELRYGMQQSVMNERASAWNIAQTLSNNSKSTGNEPGSLPSNDPSETEPVNRIDEAASNPQATYVRLSKSNRRTPQDYFILATLSDLVDRKSENIYLKWLLTGVREYPTDPGLMRLLTDYLSAFATSEIASSVLFTLSKLVEGGDFYRITEKLWDRLVSETDFATFEKSLAACESNLKHRNLRSKLTFTIHLLRRAIWKATPQWIDDNLAFIEKHGSEIDPSLDEEVELIMILCTYHRQDRSELIKKPLGETIDRLVEIYCCDGTAKGTAEAASLCDVLARNGNGLMETFKGTSDESDNRVLMLCSIVAYEIATAGGLDFENANAQLIQRQADGAISDFEKSFFDISNQLTWMNYRLIGVPFLVLWLVPIVLTFGTSIWMLVTAIWTIVCLVLYSFDVRPAYLRRTVTEKNRQLVEREYNSQWRPRLFRYVHACHCPAGEAIDYLHQSALDIGKKDLVDIVLSYAQGDNALRLFGRLQLFVQ